MDEQDLSSTTPIAAVVLAPLSLQLLLTGRAPCLDHQPGQWALPSGLDLPGEFEEDTARRCVSEADVRCRIAQIERLGSFGETLGKPHWIAFLALSEEPQAGVLHESSSAKALWWQVEHLPALACGHASIVRYALKTVRLKLARTENALAILPEQMTLAQVRHLRDTLALISRG